ncbi:type IV pilus modification protein PilV [Rheinheimera nanhaiensis]|uniref:Pre-pilin leader sequence n=1 Tax=Rheinheimera nanhaiensis E407-8 TaxID=562729 RepID=I1DUY4_9GAMM|nr:type IV pilus modification protein PilV [Rheinheimera nanhaiensis]GAB57862.1 pre-pilin leader sequence [Rheinheimera nanhaiensis E407-8]
MPNLNLLVRQKGVSLLEVLIAVLVLGIGLLGVAALQSSGVRNVQSAHERTVATLVAHSLSENVRANIAAQRLGTSRLQADYLGDCDGGGSQHQLWSTQLKQRLGEGACLTAEVNGGQLLINVRWDDTRGVAGNGAMQLNYRVAL